MPKGPPPLLFPDLLLALLHVRPGLSFGSPPSCPGFWELAILPWLVPLLVVLLAISIWPPLTLWLPHALTR